uniref:Uncharacterized protein n=1 Tax=Panagrolaimus superbus TaxID=310955 RepID=A0A914YFX6_9BILA
MTSSDTDFEMVLEDQKLRIIEWQHLNLWKFYPLALASSFSVRCALYPIGMTHAFSQIIKTEGITALYRGVSFGFFNLLITCILWVHSFG